MIVVSIPYLIRYIENIRICGGLPPHSFPFADFVCLMQSINIWTLRASISEGDQQGLPLEHSSNVCSPSRARMVRISNERKEAGWRDETTHRTLSCGPLYTVVRVNSFTALRSTSFLDADPVTFLDGYPRITGTQMCVWDADDGMCSPQHVCDGNLASLYVLNLEENLQITPENNRALLAIQLASFSRSWKPSSSAKEVRMHTV